MSQETRICLAGQIRSGKTTIAEYAEQKYHMVPFAFADELKKQFHKTYRHIPVEPKPRKGYQLYGQLMRYVFGEEYWLNICFDEIDFVRIVADRYNYKSSEEGFNPIITDARQPNEFERCRKEGYKIVKIVAPVEQRKARAEAAGDNFSEEDLNHETELWIEDLEADYEIFNGGAIEELYDQFDKVIEHIRSEEVHDV